jgi:hypothetical protein
MNDRIPQGLQNALARQRWQALSCTRLQGGYAASLYRMSLLDERGERREAVYKHFAPGRAEELGLYERIGPELPHGVPALLLRVDEEGGEQGMLIEYAGEVLKPVFEKADLGGKREMLRQVTELLADMHAGLADQAEAWVREGKTTVYPFHSSVQWAEDALAELETLAVGKVVLPEQVELTVAVPGSVQDGVNRAGVAGLDMDVLGELRTIADWFYPQFPAWMSGRQAFTHGDPHMENILLDGDRYRLIDWEYSSTAVPQRDLTILLQDVLDAELQHEAYAHYRTALQARGWDTETPEFHRAYVACLLDNTLMMLGWEAGKYKKGFLSQEEFEVIARFKIELIRRCAAELGRKSD